MSKNDWKTKLADFMPLYEAGAYTTHEFFWFALSLFDGEAGDRELWHALPQEVKDCYFLQMEKDVTNDATGAALAERLLAVRRAATR